VSPGFAIWQAIVFVFAGWDFECDNGVGRGQLWNHEVVVIDVA